MCVRACLSVVGSRGAALNAASASTPRVSAWSISPWTQERGPRSNSGAVSMAMTSITSVRYARAESKNRAACRCQRSPLDLEARNRTAQLRRQFGELSDRDVGLFGALGRFLGDLEDALH